MVSVDVKHHVYLQIYVASLWGGGNTHTQQQKHAFSFSHFPQLIINYYLQQQKDTESKPAPNNQTKVTHVGGKNVAIR